MSIENLLSAKEKEERRIKGILYTAAKIEAINEEAAQYECPFSFETITVHNVATDARIPMVGINERCDNDRVISRFNQCRGCSCMAFEPQTITCSRCK